LRASANSSQWRHLIISRHTAIQLKSHPKIKAIDAHKEGRLGQPST